ncbi:lysophosphatidylserine lipase ABHD12-like [Cylas formicarius]|uniref:lysophosphatidylserine lipase ABHD12-like n=1 Tax=Cylas formicarius TaxID=197179 RepID=UPI00295880B8|nr:lysophosphatidylserine lipase ABHD12-like [Cylas formicarius]XP_060520207.1 lysophosphatidylserine lipase ABHD12-like [Cylas formicarius]
MFLIFLFLILLSFLLVFVVLPLVFMLSIRLQQLLIFTHWNQPRNKSYYENFRFSGLKNRYVIVKDDDAQQSLALGLWQILPIELAKMAIHTRKFDYDEALRNGKYSVVLYFHGTGEDRTDNTMKYQLLRLFFHVIAFDYRCYGDSTNGELFEQSVVNDCIQIFQWVKNHTNAPIYIWGHSLGTAICTSMISQLNRIGAIKGLILEAPFTDLKDEIYQHPYAKYLAWLPWFEVTVIRPLLKNGFVFDTAKNILNVDCPIMIFHAEDDEVVPYSMSKQLFAIAKTRKYGRLANLTFLYIFNESLRYNHIFMYRDSYMYFYILNFLKDCNEKNFLGSHQS